MPARPIAGRLFTFRILVTTDAGEPVRAGLVRCVARIGKTALRPLARGWRRGAAYCTWKLPRTARAKTLRGSVRVNSRGLKLVHGFVRRVT